MESMKIYVGTLYRFGYDLTATGTDAESVKNALIKAYRKAYKDINGTTPGRDLNDYGVTYLKAAIDDIEIQEFTPGVVEWL